MDKLVHEIRQIGITDLTFYSIYLKGKFNHSIGFLYQALKDMYTAKGLYENKKPNYDYKLKLYKQIGKIYMDVNIFLVFLD